MPNFCAVVGCGTRGDRDSNSFFRIPAIPTRGKEEKIKLSSERRQKWIAALKRADLTETKLKYAKICDKHFINGHPAILEDIMNPDWVPNQVMGYEITANIANPMNRYNRSKLRLERFTEAATSHASEAESTTAAPEITDDRINDCHTLPLVDRVDIGIQTDLTVEDINRMSEVINTQTVDICKLKEKLNSLEVSEESFRDDNKTKFYTGLENFQILMLVFQIVSPDLNETAQSSLTKFQQIILTLQKLRLNLSLSDLAYRNGISVATASKIFQSCTYVMWKRLKKVISWPERDVLRKTMPSSFIDSFGKKVAVIIDCFEVKTEKPSNLMSSAQVWSNYKQHHTTKFLIGICPQGAITFISSGWGGRTSDKELALNCGILEKLLPGDLVLSDRGFLIADAVGLYCAEVQMPCFVKGKRQLSPHDVEKNRKISNVRIHVERVIGSLRQKFQILHSVLPIHLLQAKTYEDAPAMINQIVVVCCALVNLCPTVVPQD